MITLEQIKEEIHKNFEKHLGEHYCVSEIKINESKKIIKLNLYKEKYESFSLYFFLISIYFIPYHSMNALEIKYEFFVNKNYIYNICSLRFDDLLLKEKINFTNIIDKIFNMINNLMNLYLKNGNLESMHLFNRNELIDKICKLDKEKNES